MLGKVTVWQMTPEQLAEYVEKYPIRPTEKPKGAAFDDIHAYGERKKKINPDGPKKTGKRITDGIDIEKFNKMFRSGVKLADIATAFNISIFTVHNYIKEQRKKDPEKWPYRK